MNHKITLGTAQFGLDYGISNKSGKTPFSEIKAILSFAKENMIFEIDTAQTYGNSEENLGKAFSFIGAGFSITTKISHDNITRIKSSVKESLDKLNCNHLNNILFHSFTDFKSSEKSLLELQELKKEKKCSNVGFSLYFPDELEYLLNNNFDFDIIQIPYNIFDRRFEKYFEALNQKGIKIQCRSIYLQGLFFLNPDSLAPFFNPIKQNLICLHKFVSEHNIRMSDLCLGFVLNNPFINQAIVGIESLDNLKETCEYKYAEIQPAVNEFMEVDLSISDEQFLIPYKWKI